MPTAQRKDGVGTNAAVFREDTGLKNRRTHHQPYSGARRVSKPISEMTVGHAVCRPLSVLEEATPEGLMSLTGSFQKRLERRH